MRTFTSSLTSVVVGALAAGFMGCPAPTPTCDLVANGVCPTGCPTDPDCLNGDAGNADAGNALCSAVPSRNFGTDVGKSFEGFTLQQCDGSDFNFYNDQFCDESHTITVLSIAAEWCAPCREESRQLRDRILLPFEERGLRIVQVVVQNASYGPPDLDLCNRWVAAHNLEGVIEVIDPDGLTSPFFPSGSLPSTAIIDETGAIVFRENGASPNLVTLSSAVERELTRLGR